MSPYAEMPYVPPDAVEGILSRLPVKSLLRFRCASTSWCSVIDSSQFVTLHLNRSIERKTDCSLLLEANQLEELLQVDFNPLAMHEEYVNLIPHPLGCEDYEIQVWGSCNGLVCLSAVDAVVLWNPATRTSWELPHPPIDPQIETEHLQSVTYGFWYDSLSDDYKVIRIVLIDDVCNEVQVYSLKSNSWHSADEFPYYPDVYFRVKGQAIVNGSLHWVVSHPGVYRSNKIVAFDTTSEKFSFFSAPDSCSDESNFMSVDNLQGCLSVTANYIDTGKVDIWLMKDYTLEKSWTKIISLTQLDECINFTVLKVVTFPNMGVCILLEDSHHKLLWYDTEKKTVEELKVQGMEALVRAELCIGSLVSPKGGIEDDQKA